MFQGPNGLRYHGAIQEVLSQPRKKRSKKKEEKCTSKEGECRKHRHAMHQIVEELRREVGEENTKNND